ncbi:MAG: VOC family protein [Thermoplasmata archaeon]|nr:VOC family protein [Thermoplasmata archaeon]
MRFLHTSITVADIDASIAFYTGALGLEFERRRKIPENKAEIAFVRDPLSDARVELTHWEEKPHIEAGEQLDHLAFQTDDLDAFLATARSQGVRVAKEPYRLVGGTSRIAFILDPDNVWIEVIERKDA